MRQLRSPSSYFDPRSAHGGSVREGRRKLARPIAPRLPMHVVLRSAQWQGRDWGMLHRRRARPIALIVAKAGKQFHVQVHQYANANNHLHLLIQGKTREGIQNFLRTIGAQIATYVSGARRGQPKGRFWDALAYSRLVAWGRDFTNVQDYILRNEMEAAWVQPYRRKGRYANGPP